MKINIITPDALQAYESMRSNIEMLNWAEKNNRPYQMNFYKKLNHPIINKMIDDRLILEQKQYDLFDDKHKNEFIEKFYPTFNYTKIVEQLNNFLPTIKKVFPKFQELNKSWGFKIFDQYNILIDLFSPAGKYNSKQGLVKLGISDDKQDLIINYAFVIIHEMVHLGIEEYIVQKYNLPQEEKERIVDNLCIYVCQDIIEPIKRTHSNGDVNYYQPVAQCAAYMDEVVGNQPENNLVNAVEAFINSNIKRYHMQ